MSAVKLGILTWEVYGTDSLLEPAVFVGILWISGLSGGFICEFLQFCYCLFGCWWSDKDTDCTCCVDCILKCLTSFESEESQLSRNIWHVQIFFVVVFVSDELYTLRGQCTVGGTLELQQVNVTQEERVVSGSDSFSRACATSYRFCTELVHLFRVFGFFESFVHHVTAPYA